MDTNIYPIWGAILSSFSHGKTEMARKSVTCKVTGLGSGEMRLIPSIQDDIQTANKEGRKQTWESEMDPGERQIRLFRQQYNLLSAFNKSIYDQKIDNHAWLGPASVSPKEPHTGCKCEQFKALHSHTFWGNDNFSWGTYYRQLMPQQ